METNVSEFDELKSNKGLNIKLILGLVRIYWILFFICISIALIDAYLIHRYSTPYYKVQGDILLSNQSKGKEGAEILGTEGFSQAFSPIDATLVNDKIEYIKSKKFIKDVVKKIGRAHV